MTTNPARNIASFAPTDQFVQRHIGPDPLEVTEMLSALDCTDIDTLISEAIPPAIRTTRELDLESPAGVEGLGEGEALEVIERVGPSEAYLTHISHLLGKHRDVAPDLPRGVFLGEDGLRISAA